MPRLVIDTNVLLSGLQSKNGASYKVICLFGKDLFTVCVSVPLILEYESVLKRENDNLKLAHQDIDGIIDYICKVAEHRNIYYLWQPFLRDSTDDMVLEVAVESDADCICTFNVRDFLGAGQFGVSIITPPGNV